MATVETQIAQVSGTITPVKETYRWDGTLWVPTHPPYQEPAQFSGRDDIVRIGPACFTASDPSSTATRLDSFTNGAGANNNFAAWLLTNTSPANKITTQDINIPTWWKKMAIYIVIMKNSGGMTGNTKWQVQRQWWFDGESGSGNTDRYGASNLVTTPVAATANMSALATYQTQMILVDDDVILPAMDPTMIVPWPWWRMRITRSATGDTTGSTTTTVGVLGLILRRRA